MKQITFQNARRKNLAGDFYKADSNKVIIMMHGFTGDKSEHGRFDKAADALYNNGYNVLNFDFSGSGESDDDFISVAREVDDLKYAINDIKNRGLKKIGLFGHSLGGLVCLKNTKSLY